jgi:hypothetical protein
LGSGFTFFVFTIYDLLSLGVAATTTGATVVITFGWATVVVVVVPAVDAGVAVDAGAAVAAETGAEVVAGAAVVAGCTGD